MSGLEGRRIGHYTTPARRDLRSPVRPPVPYAAVFRVAGLPTGPTVRRARIEVRTRPGVPARRFLTAPARRPPLLGGSVRRIGSAGLPDVGPEAGGSPFRESVPSSSVSASDPGVRDDFRERSGKGGIRTHAPRRTTAFRVRLVMTTSIPFQGTPNAGVGPASAGL